MYEWIIPKPSYVHFLLKLLSKSCIIVTLLFAQGN